VLAQEQKFCLTSNQGGSVRGSFSGKVALVAGAARSPGLGASLARLLAQNGARVICIDAVGTQPDESYDTGIATAKTLHEIATEVSSLSGFIQDAEGIAVNPYDPIDWARAVETTIERVGGLDIGAAFMGTTGPHSGDGSLLNLSVPSWQRCLDVNLHAPFLFGQACAKEMVNKGAGGALCFLSSYSAVVGPAGFGAVAAARAALQHLVEVFALELGPHSIRVNAVAPLSVQNDDPRFPNPGLAKFANADASLSQWAHANLPLGRPQSPTETAAVAAFLCSTTASFVSGVTVPVAGGVHAHS